MSKKKTQDELFPKNKVKQNRKEINLGDLRKALDESLENKKEEEMKNEKMEDTNKELNSIVDNSNGKNKNNINKKGLINPGQKVKL